MKSDDKNGTEGRNKKKGEGAKSTPGWMGKYPFPPEEKKPLVITGDKELAVLYGFEGSQVECQIFVSTDKITFNEWTLPPGAIIDPPGMHNYGDEVYYFLEGDPIAFNPENGEVYQLHAGDALFIPQGARHQIFNFTNANIRALGVVAPRLWADDGIGSVIPTVEKPRFYKCGEDKDESEC